MHLNAQRGRRNRLLATVAAAVAVVVALGVLVAVRARGHDSPPAPVVADESARADAARRAESEAFYEIERALPPELRGDRRAQVPLPGDDPGQVARSGVDPAQLPPSAVDPAVQPSAPPAPGSPACTQAYQALLGSFEPALGADSGLDEVRAQLARVTAQCSGAVASQAAVVVAAFERTWGGAVTSPPQPAPPDAPAGVPTRDPQGVSDQAVGADGPTRG